MNGPGTERLNKVLARHGIASRRAADALITAGRVTVNGKVAAVGTLVHPATDQIRVDGELLRRPESPVTVALNKPRNVLTTVSDPHGRPTVMDYVDLPQRVFPVGRLDFGSEGLVLLTNDGELAQLLLHPSGGHEREYRVRVSGTPTDEALSAWREGTFLDDGRTAPAEVVVESSSGGSTWLRFTLREGRNRQIRRMVEALRHEVHRLVRVRMGAIRLGDLPSGQWRELSDEEVAALKSRSGGEGAGSVRVSPKRPRRGRGWARPRPSSRARRRRASSGA